MVNVTGGTKGCNTCRRRKKGVSYGAMHAGSKIMLMDGSVTSIALTVYAVQEMGVSVRATSDKPNLSATFRSTQRALDQLN